MKIRNMFFICFLNLFILDLALAEENTQLPGINLPTAGYNSATIPGRHGFNYLWPTPDEIERFSNAGFKVMRIAFLWERMQPQLNGDLSESEAKRLDDIVAKAEKLNVHILLDLHNYGAFKGKLIGAGEVTSSDFANIWKRLASRYKQHPNVIYGLMNEPNKQTTTQWAAIAQEGIAAIRSAGGQQMIFVPGTKWSAAYSWTSASLAGPSNADTLYQLNDPLNNLVFELHNYFDIDSSGTHPECISRESAVNRLKNATESLRQNKRKAFLGEFGVAQNDSCLNTLDGVLTFLSDNKDVWLGWTYWSASKWGGRYMYDVYTLDSDKQPQFGILKKYLKP